MTAGGRCGLFDCPDAGDTPVVLDLGAGDVPLTVCPWHLEWVERMEAAERAG